MGVCFLHFFCQRPLFMDFCNHIWRAGAWGTIQTRWTAPFTNIRNEFMHFQGTFESMRHIISIGKFDKMLKFTKCASLLQFFLPCEKYRFFTQLHHEKSDFHSTMCHHKFRFCTKLCVMKNEDFPLIRVLWKSLFKVLIISNKPFFVLYYN